MTLGLVLSFVFLASNANSVLLVETNDPGFYNNNIGTLLNLSNTGIDDANEPFPVSDDSSVTYANAPDLSAAGAILGNWLSAPDNLNTNWSANPIAIPNNWAVSTEVAVVYQFDTLEATNVVAQFGVDNGIFAWLDGEYIFGARGRGGVTFPEYTLNLGDFDAGTHYLQLLLEDHGSTNGYRVEINADTYTPGNPAPIPSPGTASLILAAGFGLIARRKQLGINRKVV